jgi:glycosyltransferase involved in cell wall biosynthesis
MPTRNRPQFVERACEYFFRQSYRSAELIVVVDGLPSTGFLPDSDRVRVVEVPDRRTIGEKRNIACAFARGEVVAHWDDDDWYGPDRLELQVRPLLQGQCEITGLACEVVLELSSMEFWQCSPEEHRRLFEGDVVGGTLAYLRRVWLELARYPKQSLGEDASFLRDAVRRGARLKPIRNHGQFIYVRHGRNTWRVGVGQGASWTQVPKPVLSTDDLSFYRATSGTNQSDRDWERHSRETQDLPFVSCIMPTANRREFVRLAVEYYQRQDYARRELVVVDDGPDSVADLVERLPDVRYVRVASGLSLGSKRNLACEEATGNIIVHWDDDDWYSPNRISYQVGQLLRTGVQVCGLSEVLFFDIRKQQGWRYSFTPNGGRWVAGATLCYWAAAWRDRRFADLDTGEDNRFVSEFENRFVLAHDNSSFFVGIIHESNSSRKNLSAPCWTTKSEEAIRQTLGRDFVRYALRGELPTKVHEQWHLSHNRLGGTVQTAPMTLRLFNAS